MEEIIIKTKAKRERSGTRWEEGSEPEKDKDKNTIRLLDICKIHSRCQVVFLRSFISALFLSFFQTRRGGRLSGPRARKGQRQDMNKRNGGATKTRWREGKDKAPRGELAMHKGQCEEDQHGRGWNWGG